MSLSILSRAACLVLAASLTSCGLYTRSSNEPLDAATIKSLQPGKTTAKDVAEKLGAPSDVVELGKGSAWLYDHSKSKTAGLFLVLLVMASSDERSDRLWVFFDERGVLTHYGATLAAKRSEFSLPW